MLDGRMYVILLRLKPQAMIAKKKDREGSTKKGKGIFRRRRG